jgi:hypothetical protein
LFLCYKLAFRQYSQVFGNGLPRRVKMLGERIWRHSLQGDQGYNCPSRRVGYGLKNVSSHDLYEIMQQNGCGCKRNCSVSQFFWIVFQRVESTFEANGSVLRQTRLLRQSRYELRVTRYEVTRGFASKVKMRLFGCPVGASPANVNDPAPLSLAL